MERPAEMVAGDASKEAVEEEESTGGVKDNVEDEWDESQER